MSRAGLHARSFDFKVRALGTEERPELWTEGYAVVFDTPTVLWESDGIEYREQIAGGAFENCQMADVIFNYNHTGKVMARTRNKTLQLEIDEKGLFIRARLDGTEEGRRLYDEISKGYIDRMSFQFAIGPEDDADVYDKSEHMWTVNHISKLWDVSAVDIPAYDDTSIAARKADAEAAALDHQRAADAVLLRKKRMELQIKLL